MGTTKDLCILASELPTCILVNALLERITESNGLIFCDATEVAALRDALTYEPFGERLLLAFVMLYYECDTGGADEYAEAMFYDLLDSQTDEEAQYYIECHEQVHGF
jgi:hypothetical protein